MTSLCYVVLCSNRNFYSIESIIRLVRVFIIEVLVFYAFNCQLQFASLLFIIMSKIRQKYWGTWLTTILRNPVSLGATTLLRYSLFYAPLPR